LKNVVILGSTGSIGKNALKVVSDLDSKFKVTGLAAGRNTDLLCRQVKKFRPRAVAVKEKETAQRLKARKSFKGVKVLCGTAGLCELVSGKNTNIVLIAISGSEAIYPLLKAIEKNKIIALANKEAVVSAGRIIMKRLKDSKAVIIPVDSEHSAIYQCLSSRNAKDIKKIYLTGSGGPLWRVPYGRFGKLTVSEVTKHPKWKMGKKISVDSATFMNKGLEIIEARWLFGVDPSRIEVLVHPQALVHSMVEFVDGSVMAQLAVADMKLPIQYAFTYPERHKGPVRRIDFGSQKQLSFYRPDLGKFPCLSLAIYAAKKGGDWPAVLNAANETAVKAFLDGDISFNDIYKTVSAVVKRHKGKKNPSLEHILSADKLARERTNKLCYRQ
jgi:1-deoxy-D-xylulose-5-phosphate reductoisomerase